MRISEEGIALIKKFEGCRLNSYLCPAGVWTIGYGHTGPEVVPNLVWSQAQADVALLSDLTRFEIKVVNYDSVYHWTQNEFDALVSFAFNLGTIKQLTNDGKRSRQEIIQHWSLYCNAGGKKLPGLVRRREEELKLFTKNSNYNVN